MDRNLESVSTFGSTRKSYVKHHKAYPIVKAYNRYIVEKSRKNLNSSFDGQTLNYIGQEYSTCSITPGKVQCRLKNAENLRVSLPNVSTSSEDSETECISESEESFQGQCNDGKNDSDYAIIWARGCEQRTSVQEWLVSQKYLIQDGNKCEEHIVEPVDTTTDDKIISKGLVEEVSHNVDVQQASIIKREFPKECYKKLPFTIPMQPPKQSEMDTEYPQECHRKQPFTLLMHPPKQSLDGLNSKLYKTLLDTLQQVTCYQKPYFDFSKTFPLQQFMDNMFKNLVAKGLEDVAFMTQLHKFHRPLPFLQFGFVFPNDHTKSKLTHTGSDNIKDLKEFQNEHKRHNLRYGNIVFCQIHTQLVHAYLQKKKFGKASVHLSVAKTLVFEVEPCEFTAWFYLTEAMYHAALLKATGNCKEKTMESLQKARDHFQLEKERGNNFSYERCLILWWMFVTKANLISYNDVSGTSLSPPFLMMKLRLLETWRKLSSSDRKICKQILTLFKSEIILLMPDVREKTLCEVFDVVHFFEKYCQIEQISVAEVESSSDDDKTPSTEAFYRRKAKPKRIITRSARNAKYHGPQQSKHDGDANIETIEEAYNVFRKAMIRIKAPTFVLNSMPDSETRTIYVDIEEGTMEDAISFFKSKVPESFPLLKLTEQTPMVFIGDDMDRYSAGTENAAAEKTEPYLARASIQGGNQLLPLTQSHMDIDRLCQTKKSLKDIMHSHTGTKISTASSAGFVTDQHGTVYKLTVRHPFKGAEGKKGGWQPIPGNDVEQVPVLTEILRQDSKGEHGEVIHVGSELKSAFLPYTVAEDCYRAVDMALVKVKQETLSHPCLQLSCKNNKNENISVKLYDGSDKELLEKEVEKTGPITLTTHGRIILANQETYIDGVPCGGTFVVESTGKSSNFALKGDSGSLVTQKVHGHKEVLAFGMCFKVGNYKHPRTGVIYPNVTRCVGLQQCFAFSQTTWKLNLRFCSPSDVKLKENPVKHPNDNTQHASIKTKHITKHVPHVSGKEKITFTKPASLPEDDKVLSPILERKLFQTSDVSDGHDSAFPESLESDELMKSGEISESKDLTAIQEANSVS